MRRNRAAAVAQDGSAVAQDGSEDTQVIVPQFIPDPSYQQLIGADTRDDEPPFMIDQWMGSAPSVTRARPAHARGSALALLGLIISVFALAATLTGLLAPEGLVLGLIGALLSIAASIRAGRRGMNGRGTAAIGGLIGLGSAALAVLAMTGRYSWLDSATDQVAAVHAWLVDQWSWLGRWS